MESKDLLDNLSEEEQVIMLEIVRLIIRLMRLSNATGYEEGQKDI